MSGPIRRTRPSRDTRSVYGESGTDLPEWSADSVVEIDASTTYTVEGLTNGIEYTIEVRAIAGEVPGESASVTVMLEPPPEAPVDLRAIARDRKVRLRWDPAVDPRITGYQVRYGESGTDLPEWSADSVVEIAATTTYTVEGLTNGIEYTIEVRAIAGEVPGESAGVTATPRPGRPRGLMASAGVTTVTLEWTDPEDASITGYQVRYGESGMDLPEWSADSVVEIAASTTYTVEGLTNGIEYTIEVRAIAGEVPGASASVTVMLEPPPEAPVDLRAIARDRKVRLRWDPTVDPRITGYQVRYGESGTDLPEWSADSVVEIAATTSYTVEGLTNGIEYTIEVRAIAGEVPGESAGVTATPRPGRPRGLMASAGVTTVTLEWTDPEDASITRYQVRYWESGMDLPEWSADSVVEIAATTSYAVRDLMIGTEYTFEVRAWTGEVYGKASAVTARTDAPPPGAPVDLRAIARDRMVRLSWEPAEDPRITGYQVRYGESDTDLPEWSHDHDVDSEASTTTHTVEGLTNGIEYTIEVRAAAGEVPGESASVTATPRPGRPRGLMASAGVTTVTLEWTDPEDASITGYQVRYWETGTSMPEWSHDHDVDSEASTTTHTVEGLTNGIEYTIEVRAIAGEVPGESAGVTATPRPGRPRGLIASAGVTTVTLTWVDPEDASITGYQVRYWETGTSMPEWSHDHDVDSEASTTTHTVEGLTNGIEYTIEVRAAAGEVPGESASVRVMLEPPPGAPVDLRAIARDRMVRLSWEPAVDPRITGYQVRYGESGTDLPEWSHDHDVDSEASTTTHTVEGLTNGIEYTIEVRAAAGEVPGESASVTATPRPGRPRRLRASAGVTTVTLEWADPEDASITGYQVRYGESDTYLPEWSADSVVEIAAITTYTVEDLVIGTEYMIEVRAIAGEVYGKASAVTVRTDAPPPTNLSATVTVGTVVLTWDAPTAAAASVTGYQVLWRLPGDNAEGGFRVLATTDAMVRTYTDEDVGFDDRIIYQVKALYGEVLSPGSGEVRVYVPAPPPRPEGLMAMESDGTVVLTWNVPGDHAITGYLVRFRSRRAGVLGSIEVNDVESGERTMTRTLEDLTNGIEYTFEVQLRNAGGYSEASRVTATPGARPDPPGNLTALPGDRAVTLSWDDPGETDVTGYQIRYSAAGTVLPDTWNDIGVTTSHVVEGLDNCREYTFDVRAVAGEVPGASAGVTETPGETPGPVTGLSGTAGDGEVALTWTNPGGAIDRIEVRYAATGADLPDTWSDVGVTTSHVVEGLINCRDYRFEVRAIDDCGDGGAASVTATPGETPGEVTNLRGTAGEGEVTLTWNDPGDATIIRYQIRYAVGGTALPEDWTDIDPSDAGTTSYTVEGLDNCREYRFEVRAINGCGDGSAGSVTATPGETPEEVTNLRGTAGDGEMALTWTNPVGAIDRIEFRYAATGADLPDTWSDVGVTTSHVVEGLINCRDYRFEVRAINGCGAGLSRGVTGRPGNPPPAPVDVRVTAGEGEVTLTWTNPGDATIIRYQIRYAEGGMALPEDWTDIDPSDAGTTSYTVEGMTNCTDYWFEVRAINGCGDGSAGSVTATPGETPGPVTGLSGTAGDGEVALTWTNPGGAIDRIEVRYAATGAALPDTWSDVGVTTSHIVRGLTNCTEYSFEVRAINGCGDGSAGSVTATPGETPGPVTGLSGTAGDGEVALTWTNPGGAIDRIEVRYAATGAALPDTWSDVGVTTSHIVRGLTNCTEYSFEVRAINDCGDGNAGSITATPGETPGEVTSLRGTAGDGEVALTWTNPGGAIDRIEVRYAATGAALPDTWSDIGVTTSHVVRGLTNCTEYTFEVRAKNGCGTGGSDSENETPGNPPGEVTGLRTTKGDGQVTLHWTNPGGATGNQIRYARTGISLPATWTEINAATSHVVTGLTNCTEYTFEVRAINGCGDGSAGSVTATPGETPGPVTGLSGTAGDGEVALTWTNPGGAIDRIEVRYAATGADLPDTWSDVGVTTSHVVRGLTNCTEYSFEVRAINGCGDGSAGSVTATPGETPGEVTGLRTTKGDGQVTLRWTNPSGATRNQIRYARTGTSLPATWTEINAATSHVVRGLTNCTEYTFEVRAKNGCGTGGADRENETPGNPPGEVTGLRTTKGDGQVTLRWTNPGGAIDRIEVRYAATGAALPDTWSDIGVTTSHVVRGLTNCTEYTFEVRAKNGCGTGGADRENETPGNPPGEVTGLRTTKGDGQVTLRWTNPSGAIDRIEVRYARTGTSLPATWTEINAATSHVVRGLTNCTEYTFEVRAKNGCGTGGADRENETPGNPPGEVTGLRTTKGDGQVTLHWTNPGGATKIQYRYAPRGSSLPATWNEIDVTTSLMLTGLTNCTEYTFEVRAKNGCGTGGADTVTGEPGVKPAKVTGLRVTSMSNGTVGLSWNSLGDATVTGYEISYSGDTSGTVTVSGGTTTSHTVTRLINCPESEYTFTVLAVNCKGNGPSSDSVTGQPGVKPGQVTGVRVTSVGDGTVSLNWNSPGGTVALYRVSYNGGGRGGTTTAYGTSTTVIGLDNCTEYTFTVLAVNCKGNGPSSDSVTGTPGVKPDKVTGLSVTDTGDGTVELSWTDPNDPTITKYQIQIDSGVWRDIPESGPNTTEHTVERLTNCPASAYTFNVRAWNCKGDGSPSDGVTGEPGVKPAKVAGLRVTDTGEGTVELSWTNPNDPTITKYQIKRGSGGWSNISGSGPNTTRHEVTGLTNCSSNTFMVRAWNCKDDGPASDSVTGEPGVKPAKVTGLSVTDTGDGTVSLSWTDPNDPTIEKYQIQIDSGVWRDIPESGPNTTEHTVERLTNCPASAYTFNVRAWNCKGDGSPSDGVTGTPGVKPVKVTGLNVTSMGDGTVSLSWTDPNDPTIEKYQIKRGSGGWSDIPGSGPNTTSYTVPGLTNCNSYTFKVRAYNCKGDGPPSDGVTGEPGVKPAKVTGLRVTSMGDGTVGLSWNSPGGTIEGYKVWYVGGDTTYVTGTTTTVRELDNCTEYTFRVLAYNCKDDGPESDSVTGTPGVRPERVTGAEVTGMGDGTLTLAWDDQDDPTVTEFRISYIGPTFGQATAEGGSTTSGEVTRLTNCGAYSFQVQAVNCKGPGLSSSIVSGTPGVKPAAPAGLQVTSEDNESVSLSWNQHTDATVRGYRIIYSTSGASSNTVTVTGRSTISRTVTGLTNCTQYTFKVLAYNCKGDGTLSAGVNATPHAPLSVSSISNRAGTKGRAITSFRVGKSGGCAPYSYPPLSSSPPSGSGLSISSSGRISGSPTATRSFTITVEVEDKLDNSESTSFTFTVADPVVIASISDIMEIVSVPFSKQVSVSGGRTPYSYSVSVTPTLPQGSTLTISNSGLIEGEITGFGTYSVTVTVSDADNRTDTEEFDVTSQGPGDYNGDGRRDASDAALFKRKSGLRSSDPGFDSRMDLNGDGTINFADLVILSGYIQKDASSQSNSESEDDSE